MPSEPQARQTPGAWTGQLSDGRHAASREVRVTFEADGLAIQRPDAEAAVLHWPYASLATGAPIGRTAEDALVMTATMPRVTLFVADAGFATALAQRAPQVSLGATRRQGLRPGLVAGAFAAAVLGVVYGFDLNPSKGVASLMPETARRTLGQRVLATMPVRRQCTEPAGRAALDVLVRRLRPAGDVAAGDVVVLDWPVLNAFAVPGGRVVLTRTILERATSPDEIAGVVAHEMGHALELHPEASLVRSVGFWALIQMVFTGTPGALGNAGSLVAQLAHTRTAEREADAIALRLLREAGIAAGPFAGFFRRMETDRRRPPAETRGVVPRDVFDTHPATAERIAMIERQPTYPATPALGDAEWQALRRICAGLPASQTTPNADDVAVKPRPPEADQKRIEDLRRRMAEAPADTVGLTQQAALAVRLGQFDEAARLYDRLVALEPTSAHYRVARGDVRRALGQAEAARADYAEALRLNPQSSDAHVGLAILARQRGAAVEALADLDAALSLNPRHTGALYQRGLVWRAQKRWAEMEPDFTAVIARERGYAMAYVLRAEALEGLGQRERAIVDYRDALRGSPGSADAQQAFAIARARLAALGAAEQ